MTNITITIVYLFSVIVLKIWSRYWVWFVGGIESHRFAACRVDLIKYSDIVSKMYVKGHKEVIAYIWNSVDFTEIIMTWINLNSFLNMHTRSDYAKKKSYLFGTCKRIHHSNFKNTCTFDNLRILEVFFDIESVIF